MTRRLPRSRLERYVWAVVLIGCASVVVSLRGATSPGSTDSGITVVGLLAVGLVVGEFFPTLMWRGDGFRIYTFSGTFTLALVMLGPLWLALLVQTSALLVEDLQKRRPALKVAFNLGQYAVSITAARIAFAALTGQSVAGGSGHFVAGDILPSLVAAAVYFTVNVTLVSIVLALAEDQPALPAVASHLRRRGRHDDHAAVRGPRGPVVLAGLPTDGPPVPATDPRRPSERTHLSDQRRTGAS